MLLTVVLMLVSIATYAQGAGQCCMPLQYEAFQGSMVSKIKNGKFSTMFGTTRMVWDGVANKTYYQANTIEDGIPSQTTTIQDHPAKMMYQLTGGLCKATPITTPFVNQQCVPASAPVLAQVTFGANNALPVTVYNITTATQATFMLAQTSNCFPVMNVNTNSNPASMTVVVFMNVTAGPPSDATLFNIPSSCAGPGPVGK